MDGAVLSQFKNVYELAVLVHDWLPSIASQLKNNVVFYHKCNNMPYFALFVPSGFGRLIY